VLARYVAPAEKGSASASAAAALQFVRNAHGKPELSHPRITSSGHYLRFNLTHTGGLVGMAVGAERLIGLDAESLGRRTQGSVMRLARRRLSQPEIDALEGEMVHEASCQFRRLRQLLLFAHSELCPAACVSSLQRAALRRSRLSCSSSCGH